MPGWYTLTVVAAVILAVVVAIVRLRINPVIALAVGAAAIGILTGLGPLDTVSTMTQGFGEVMMDAGLLIAWGVLIGAMLNEMGAVTRLVEALMRVFGRRGIPFAAVGAVLSLSFAVLARQAGFSPLQAILTSALVFAGSAQFAALAVLTGGGAAAAAVAAGTLMNGRFLAMGIAIAPSLPGRPAVRAAQGQTMVDASWAMANRGDGSYDRWLMFGSTLPQYCTWVLGSVVGA